MESTTGGFKFPDRSVQTNAVGKTYTTGMSVGDVELVHNGSLASLSALTLPPGVYLVMATLNFDNRTSGFFAERVVRCSLAGERIWVERLGGQNNANDLTTITLHTVAIRTVTGDVDIACGISENSGSVFVTARRLTALRMADN